MKIIFIVQARMGSKRLPGKVLKTLGGRSVLECVLSRLQRSTLVHQVVVATSTEVNDNAIEEECRRLDTHVFRGSQNDVLDRYYHAALQFEAEAIVRVTSDCPLIDPGVSDRVIKAFLDMQPDYASNTQARTYPRGLDTEVMTFQALETSWREAREPHEREHVTPYLYEHPDRFKLLSVSGEAELAHYRWTLDTREDLRFLREVYGRLGQRGEFSWMDVIRLLEKEPALCEINGHIVQKAIH